MKLVYKPFGMFSSSELFEQLDEFIVAWWCASCWAITAIWASVVLEEKRKLVAFGFNTAVCAQLSGHYFTHLMPSGGLR